MAKRGTQNPSLSWGVSQVVGDPRRPRTILKRDCITVIKFDPSGRLLALGDESGRVIVFERSQIVNLSNGTQFIYLAEFQAQSPEFDTLRSREVSPAVRQIEWLQPVSNGLHLLVASSSSVKFWRLITRSLMKPFFGAEKGENADDRSDLPKVRLVDQGHLAVVEQQFKGLHPFPIHSLSQANDEEHFLTADDLRVFLWHIERPDLAFDLFNATPPNMANLEEVITRARLSAAREDFFAVSTSLGRISVGDTRTAPKASEFVTLWDSNKKQTSHKLWEVLDSILDFKFGGKEHSLFSRDVNRVRVWDLRRPDAPVLTASVVVKNPTHPSDLYDFNCLNDNFDLAVAPGDSGLLTGNFGGGFHMLELGLVDAAPENYKVEVQHRDELESGSEDSQREDSVDEETADSAALHFGSKVLRCDWSRTGEALAVAMDDCFWVYNRRAGRGRPPTKISN